MGRGGAASRFSRTVLTPVSFLMSGHPAFRRELLGQITGKRDEQHHGADARSNATGTGGAHCEVWIGAVEMEPEGFGNSTQMAQGERQACGAIGRKDSDGGEMDCRAVAHENLDPPEPTVILPAG